jgi:CrcB protein
VFTSESRLFVFVGILGGFTTFSSFGNETLNLARDSQMLNALANIGANVVIGLLAVWLGRTVSYLLWR